MSLKASFFRILNSRCNSYTVLDDDDADFEKAVEKASEYCAKERGAYALIAPKGVMADPEKPNNTDDVYPMSREEAIERNYIPCGECNP